MSISLLAFSGVLQAKEQPEQGRPAQQSKKSHLNLKLQEKESYIALASDIWTLSGGPAVKASFDIVIVAGFGVRSQFAALSFQTRSTFPHGSTESLELFF
jgi:hypothetical protein